MLTIPAAFFVLRAWGAPENSDRRTALVLGLVGVAVLTYFILGMAGYGVRDGGNIDVPTPIAWLVVTVLVIGFVGGILYFAGAIP